MSAVEIQIGGGKLGTFHFDFCATIQIQSMQGPVPPRR